MTIDEIQKLVSRHFDLKPLDLISARRARAVARAHRNLSFQLSGCQLAITITTLLTGFIAEPAVASLIRPGLIAVGVPERFAGGLATTLALVLATALLIGTGFALWVPGATMAAGLALGAAVAPPDPVAALSVGRRVGLPPRLITLIQGEGLLNDATALTAALSRLGSLMDVAVAAEARPEGGNSLGVGFSQVEVQLEGVDAGDAGAHRRH